MFSVQVDHKSKALVSLSPTLTIGHTLGNLTCAFVVIFLKTKSQSFLLSTTFSELQSLMLKRWEFGRLFLSSGFGSRILTLKGFLGFVDVLDVVGFTLATYHVESEHLRSPEFAASHFFNEPVFKVVNFSKADPTVVISPDASVHDLVQLLTKTRVHRVAVGTHGKISNVVTQSDVVAYISRHLSLLPNSDKSLGELNMVRAVVSVMLDSSLSDALEVLYANKVSGIALIDPDGGRVSGNLSASDLRALSKNLFREFDRSVLNYLSKSGQGVPPPRTVPETSTLAETIKILSEEKLHRVYVTNANDAIRGVISLGDIIKLVHPHHKSHHHHHHHKK